MRQTLQHQLNSLHLMVRLTRLGLSRSRALSVARFWEMMAHPWLYGLARRHRKVNHGE